jgi:AcrR family transcriptional regulator
MASRVRSPQHAGAVRSAAARRPHRGAPSEGAPRVQIGDIQRARLISAAVAAIDEVGYTSTTVAHITHRAGVSRRTFYDLFENCEECLLAVLEEILGQLDAELAAAGLEGLAWRERIRAGLWAILCFFDREPALARICVVQSARGSQRVLERREEVLGRLAAAIDEGRREGARQEERLPLTAEGLVGAGASILYTRLLKGEREPLGDLLGELMGMIVLPYLGPAAARRERARPAPPLRRTVADGGSGGASGVGVPPVLRDIPMRLTYRTVRVLENVGEHPGASNRAVAERVGIADQGQVSKLLARLERIGLLQNTGMGHTRGEPNAWRLTPLGQQVAQSVRMPASGNREAA